MNLMIYKTESNNIKKGSKIEAPYIFIMILLICVVLFFRLNFMQGLAEHEQVLESRFSGTYWFRQ